MARRRTGSCGRSWLDDAWSPVRSVLATHGRRPAGRRPFLVRVGIVNDRALRVLEFHEVLERVAARASSSMGREAVLSLRPMESLERAERELARVAEAVSIAEGHPEWAPPAVPDVRRPLRTLDVDGGVLDPVDLLAVARLLDASRLLAEALAEEEASEMPLLTVLRDRLHLDGAEEEQILRVVDEQGEVRDEASPALRGIRRRLRSSRGRIVKRLEAYLRTLPERWVVPDASISIRDGRYVISVRREAKGEVGGVVHGESGSGGTLFVEPPLAIALMNELRDLERDELREIQRLLRECTDRLRPTRGLLRGSFEALVDFDALWARGRAALAWEGVPPELVRPEAAGFVLARARHPLLLEQSDGPEVVPYHLELLEDERVLVVSGPNTGGKTVFLKSVGLLVALAESGVIPPTGPGTRLPFVREIFTDIGDEQSIAESLSTFSAHLRNQREIVEGAAADALVLMDEMGTGTDPAEGAALARAVLEELAARGALAFATSHLGALKRLDAEGSRIVNASLEFDPERIAPTYVLRKGRPGRSYGLAIARRLDFPHPILDRAERYMGEGEVNVEALLETLERKEREAKELLDDLSRKQQEVDRLQAELGRRESELRSRERTAERRAREEARRLLLEAREEVEEAIDEVRRGGEKELNETARRARQRVEGAARSQQQQSPTPSREAGHPPDYSTGDRVRVVGSGTRGIVTEIRDDRVTVEASGLRLQLSASDLELVEGGPGPEKEEDRNERPRSRGWTGPAPDAQMEADLRGLRVDEVDGALHRFLDQAVIGDLAELRIIHGKGTGAVRARVRELLEKDPRIETFRPGGAGEGGVGVTVVTLR